MRHLLFRDQEKTTDTLGHCEPKAYIFPKFCRLYGTSLDTGGHFFAKHHRTRYEMQRELKTDLAEWHDRPIASITRADIKAMLREKARTAPISANRLGALISNVFNWALGEEIIQASPALMLPRYGQEVERERNLTPSEIKAAWAAFERLGHPFGPLLKMLLVTGQRRSEVAGMKLSEVDGDYAQSPNCARSGLP
jgi:integrase